MRTAVFPLPEGDVSVTYPALLSDESRDLLQYQIEGMMKLMALAKKAAPILYPNKSEGDDEWAAPLPPRT